VQLQADGSRFKVPPNGLEPRVAHRRPGRGHAPSGVGEVPDGSYFYFVHSYYA